MNDPNFLERGKEFAHHLAVLQGRLRPDEYALLLRMLHGLNDAFAQGQGGVSIEFSPEERRLLTPRLGREFAKLALLLGSRGVEVSIDRETAEQAVAAERERDRREVEGIARASGMSLPAPHQPQPRRVRRLES